MLKSRKIPVLFLKIRLSNTNEIEWMQKEVLNESVPHAELVRRNMFTLVIGSNHFDNGNYV